jgi:beta-glucosidase
VGSANTVATIQTVATMAVVVVGVLALLAVILVVLSLVKKGTQKTGRPGEIASRVGAAVGALLLMIAMTGTSLANASASQVNSYMGTTSTKVISEGDATYFSSEFDSWEAQFENAKRVGVRIQEEGSVLMKNDNRSLPLSEGAKVSLFSRSSVDIVYGGAGSGTIDTSLAPTLKSALEAVGMDVNDTLWDFYGGQTEYVRSLSDVAEVPVSAFSNDVIASYDQYGDAAIVVLARACGEGEDLSAEAAYLEIKDEERALLAHVTEYFDNVIVLINSGNAVALDWLLEYDVDSVLWIGLPGQNGLEGVANLLVGGVTPSGKLADVYAANSFSSAAMQNFGEYYYTNSEIVPSDSEFTATANFTDSTDTKHLIPGSPAYLVQAEGIYVGYKYYETRYEDTVLGQGNASGSAGAYESANGKWNYADEVAYTFGHGLSYTTFEQTLDAFEQEGDQVKLTVTVKNTGNAYGGKDVVEVYAQAPYIAGGVEKASVQLCGFAKTGELAPGDSQTVEITVDLDDVASYDAENEEAYILDAGTYYFAVGSDAHDALNNILAAKGKTVADGMDYDGDAALVGSVELAGEVIDADPASGGKIENRFEQGDLNYYGDYVTYLSRGDWQNTWPKTFENLEATDAMIADLENDYTSKATDITELTYNEDNGLTLVALREAEYDDPRWEQLLNQMSFEEQVEVVKSGASQTAAVASIAFSGTVDEDGPAGLSKRTYYENPKDSGTSTNTNAYGYSASVVIASTWSTDMAYERGVSVGEDGLWTNVVGWWGPACNTHRTPYGGRNFEYYSEDAYLGGMIAASDVAGAQSKGMRSFIKHFAGNEQETHRHGVSTFSTEQAFREIYLKQFEHVVKDGETLSMMESYTRIGCVWAGASALCDGLLRGEWGFVGGVLTDFNVHNDEGWMNVRSGLAHGVNQWLSFGECDLAEYAKDDIGLAVEIRDSCHHVLYAVSRTAAMNGMDENARIEFVNTWWQNSLYMLVAASAVLTVACLVGVVSSVLRKRNKLAVQSEKEER